MEKPASVLSYVADFKERGFWRVLWPELMLNMKVMAKMSHFSTYIRDFVHYARADVVFLQKQQTPGQLEFFQKLHSLKEKLNFRMIYEADDIFFDEDIPDYNHGKLNKKEAEAVKQSTKQIIELCDEMVTASTTLRQYYLDKTDQKQITVIPNFPPLFWIGYLYSEELLLRNYEKHKKRPRILYTGSASHFDILNKTPDGMDDFYHVRKAIIDTRKEFKWVFLGKAPKELMPYIEENEIEVHPWQTIESYPKYIAHLEASMMIAPLQNNLFNQAKSNIKFLESCAVGLPIACQNLNCYQDATILFQTGDEMIQQIRSTLSSRQSFIEASRMHRRYIDDKWLEIDQNIGCYQELFTYPYGDSRRVFLKNHQKIMVSQE